MDSCLPGAYGGNNADSSRLFGNFGGRRQSLQACPQQDRTCSSKSRKVTVYAISLLRRQGDTFVFDVTCSAGTYIRALARDVAEACGTVGYMSAPHKAVLRLLRHSRRLHSGRGAQSGAEMSAARVLRAVRRGNAVPSRPMLRRLGLWQIRRLHSLRGD